MSIMSLPVRSVQELAAAAPPSREVLQRYERPEITGQPVRSDAGADEIPVIDFSRLLDPQLSDEEAKRLHLACEEWGFFQEDRGKNKEKLISKPDGLENPMRAEEESKQASKAADMEANNTAEINQSEGGTDMEGVLLGHGTSDELIEKMKVVIKEFFQLPLEEKQAFAQLPGDVEGYGQIFVVSDDQKLDWADVLLLRTQPLITRKMNFWPTHPAAFRDTLDQYTAELKEVAYRLFELIAKNLGAEPKKFADRFVGQSVRINYYPPCPQADKVLGLSPHSDADGITLLLQINEVQGLQIKKDGTWLPVKPLPGALVVNVGDVLEVLSNGKYKSIEHRAVIDPKKERLSIATFHNVMNSMVGPLPEIVKGSEENYITMSHEDFMKIFFSRKLDGKNLIDYVKLKK